MYAVPVPRSDGDWVTVHLGSDDKPPEERAAQEDMKARVRAAGKMASVGLSERDADELQSKLRLDADIFAALEAQENAQDWGSSFPSSSSSKNSKKPTKKMMGVSSSSSSSSSSRVRDLMALSDDEMEEVRKIKGFLELNPSICSGCGTPFQSKAEEQPGFLPKDKFADHRVNAEAIKAKQEAIRILELAGT
jgi:hypothetical protein